MPFQVFLIRSQRQLLIAFRSVGQLSLAFDVPAAAEVHLRGICCWVVG